jgi:8-amino-7-oxononanoate synthase
MPIWPSARWRPWMRSRHGVDRMLFDLIETGLQEREAQHLRRSLRVADSPCAPHQNFDGLERLTFCSNDYLGLAAHPALIEALADGARRWGAGSGASHLISGHSRAHAELEARLGAWMSAEIPEARALYVCTGYMANLALLTGLAEAGGRRTLMCCEKLNHASLIDGARLAGAASGVTVRRYPHANVARLEALLSAPEAADSLKLIVTDAVFSMDGDIAPLAELLVLAERHDAWLVVDDAHGFGVLGPQGRGTLAMLGLRSSRLILMGTLGKAAGVGGAFIAADARLIDWLINVARPYIYTTAAPPALATALQVSLDLIQSSEGQQRRERLQGHIDRLQQRLAASAALAARGWQLLPSPTAIQPLQVSDNGTALALSRWLEGRGLRVPAIRPPTVPAGTARLRIALSAAHEPADLDRLIDALEQAAGALDV